MHRECARTQLVAHYICYILSKTGTIKKSSFSDVFWNLVVASQTNPNYADCPDLHFVNIQCQETPDQGSFQ